MAPNYFCYIQVLGGDIVCFESTFAVDYFMNLTDITPIIMTYNEEPNIGRCLERLTWAQDIVVLDSFSTDQTCAIISRYKNTRLFQRSFNHHADQWSFAIKQTCIQAEWVLALDADYVLSEDLIKEMKGLELRDDIEGYTVTFVYKINGRILRSSLYPPVTILYRKKKHFMNKMAIHNV